MRADAQAVARDLRRKAEECAAEGDHRGAATLYRMAAEFALGERDDELGGETEPRESHRPAFLYGRFRMTSSRNPDLAFAVRLDGQEVARFRSPAHAHRVMGFLRDGYPLAEVAELIDQERQYGYQQAEVIDPNAPETVRAGHTPVDSLIYLARGVNGLLDAADEEIHGVYTDTITETEDLPEHLSNSVSMIKHAARIIQHEATLHGAYRRRFYDNEMPTSEVRQNPHHEPQDDGTTRIVMADYHYDLYPDGLAHHPLSRDESYAGEVA